MPSAFNTRFSIGDRRIGDGEPVYVIAEIGSNHNQDLARAKELIDAAAEAGADAAKFQSLTFDELYLAEHTTPEFQTFFRDIELPEEWYPHLATHCRERGLHFLSSPTYPRAVELLRQNGAPALKIASAQFALHPDLIQLAASSGLPLIMSTGLADYGDIERTLDICRTAGNHDVVLLHCVSRYPTEMADANLRLIETYRRSFGCLVGFSDHTLGTHVPVAAVTLGAAVIEKHITLDRRMEGPDHHYAAEPKELAAMVRDIRDIEAALGDGTRRPLGSEEQRFIEEITMTWVAGEDLPAGAPITREALTLRRTAAGIPQKMIQHLLLYRTRRAIAAGTPLSWDDVEHVG